MFGQDSYKYFYKFMKTYEMLSFCLNTYQFILKKCSISYETAPIFLHTIKSCLNLKS